MPTHLPVANPGGIMLGGTPLPHVRGGALDLLPDWWAILAAGSNSQAPEGATNFADKQFPLSRAVAPTDVLPVAFGSVRVGGSEIFFGTTPGGFGDQIDGTGVIAICEGEIEAIDSFIVNGQAVTSTTTDNGSRTITLYTGAAGDSHLTGVGEVFHGKDVTGFAGVAYVHFRLLDPSSRGWWAWLPNFAAGTYEWAADVRGLKVYDPRSGLTVYSRNPILQSRYVCKRYGHRLDAEFDDVNIAAMATACDSAGLTCDIVFPKKIPLDQALAQILQTCNGKKITTSNGLTGFSLNLPNAGPAAATLDESIGEVWDLKYEDVSARDRFTRLAVSFMNKDADYKPDQTPDFDDPGIALGTVPIKSTVIAAPGINTMAAAIILRDFLYNVQVVRLRVSGSMNAKGLQLQEGQKITLLSRKYSAGVDLVLNQIDGNESGFFAFVSQPYNSHLWDSTPISGSDPLVPPPPPDPSGTIGVPEITLPRPAGAGWPDPFRICWDLPRQMLAQAHYGASYWSVTNGGTVDTSKINDGLVVDAAFDWTPAADTIVHFDRGVGMTSRFVKLGFAFAATVPTNWPVPVIEHSDDDSSWSSVSSTFWRYLWLGGVIRGFEFEWPDAGGHRYWRFRKGSSASYPIYLTELQWREWDGVVFADSDVDHYEIHARSTIGGATSSDPIAIGILGSARPTTSSFLDLSALTFQTGLPDPTYIFDYLKICVVTVTRHGLKSVGVNIDFGALSPGPRLVGGSGPLALPIGDPTKFSGAPSGMGALMVSSVNGGIYKSQDGNPYSSVLAAPGTDTGRGTMVEQPAGTINGSNRLFTLSKTPSSSRILLISDNMPLVGGLDFSRSGPNVRFALAANKPANSLLAVYPYGDIDDGGGTPELSLPIGSAATWAAGTGLPAKPWSAVAFDPIHGVWAAINQTGTTDAVYTSVDGHTWSAHTISTALVSGGWMGLCWGSAGFVAVNHDNTGFVLTSGDGATWTVSTIATASAFQKRVISAPGLGLYIASASVLSFGQPINTSPDGLIWTRLTGAPVVDAMCWSEELHLAVAVGLNTVYTSSDGITFTAGTIPTGAWVTVCWSPELGLFVASNGGLLSGAFATSPDGFAWTAHANPLSTGWHCITWSAPRRLFVATSPDNPETQAVATSPDGVNWTQQATGAPLNLGWGMVVAADSPDVIVAISPNAPYSMRSLA